MTVLQTLNYYRFQIRRSVKRFIFTKYFSLRKFFNVISLMFQGVVLKSGKVSAYPLKISFDPTNICMLKCPLCPTGRGSKDRDRGMMKLVSFKKLLDEVGAYLYEIDFNNWGEPFLNKESYDMIAEAHGRKIWTSINTNLNVPFSDETAKKLVESGLDQLYCSIDGITQKTYEIYRKGGKLEVVVANLKIVNKWKKKLNSKTPLIKWQFLVMKHNEHELPKLEETRKKWGADELAIGAVRSELDTEIFKKDEQKVDETSEWLPKNEDYSRYDYEKKERKVQKSQCYFPWLVSVVNWDGSVSPCCGVYAQRYDFGNAFKSSFMKIWNNDKYRDARDIIAKRSKKKTVVCWNCTQTGFID
ncbi:MAG: radical SAM protein [Candidatus Diapherotrites archaeon]